MTAASLAFSLACSRTRAGVQYRYVTVYVPVSVLNIPTSSSVAPSPPSSPPPPSFASHQARSSCSVSGRRCRCAPAVRLLSLCGTTLCWTGIGTGILCAGSSSTLGTWSVSWSAPCLEIATGTGSVSYCACCFWSAWTGTSYGSESGPWCPADCWILRLICVPNQALHSARSSLSFLFTRTADVALLQRVNFGEITLQTSCCFALLTRFKERWRFDEFSQQAPRASGFSVALRHFPLKAN